MSLRHRITARLRKIGGPGLERGDRKAVVLSVASNKGGVGKTTTAVHLGLGFAEAGARVLLVDLDPQAHVGASLGTEPPAGNGTLSEVLRGTLEDVVEAAYPSGYDRLTLAGSEKDLSETEAVIAAKIGKELLLSGALEVAATHFDLIVFDCPPNLGTLTLNALCASDALLIPCDMSVLALEGVGDILAAVDTLKRRLQRPVEVLGILATRYDRRTRAVNDTVVQSLGDLYGDRMLETRIPMASAVTKAQMACKPLSEFAPRSTAAAAYADLVRELAPTLNLDRFVTARVEEPATVGA